MEKVKSENMAPFYAYLKKEFGWSTDETLMSEMKSVNEKRLEELDVKIKDAEENFGETEIREAMLEKAHYFSQVGDKENALSQLRTIYEKTVMLGYRLDLIFHQIRIGFFFMDRDLITRNIEKAQSLIDEGGDWDRRNRLKVYRGLYSMSVRDFQGAAEQFLDAVATFTSYELMDYKEFIAYTVLTAIIALKRPELREKVVRGSEILEVLHSLPAIRDYLMALFECHYAEFFRYLAGVEAFLKQDRYLAAHARYYVREMRILAYAQHLESYSSLTIESLAKQFGVTIEFIDQELSRFIAAGRLSCKIDKVGGVVETIRPDNVNFQYHDVIKHGDVLLNRVQKLSRVINI